MNERDSGKVRQHNAFTDIMIITTTTALPLPLKLRPYGGI